MVQSVKRSSRLIESNLMLKLLNLKDMALKFYMQIECMHLFQLVIALRGLSQMFLLCHCSNMNGSVAQLAKLSKAAASDYRNGKLEGIFNYEEFLQQVRELDQSVDFHQHTKNHIERLDNKLVDTSDASNLRKLPVFPVLGQADSIAVHERSKKGKSETIQYDNWKLAQLKDECEKFGLPKTGKKADLITRLQGPRPPHAWLKQKEANVYVPTQFDNGQSWCQYGYISSNKPTWLRGKVL